MAQYILQNDVLMAQGGQVARLRAGKLVDDASQNTAQIIAAGGVLVPVSQEAAANIAQLVKNSRYKGQSLDLEVARAEPILPSPAAPAGAGLVSLPNQSGATMHATIVAAAWSYTPTSSGLTHIAINWAGNTASPAAPYMYMEIFKGGAVGGGTLSGGVNYLSGTTPTRTGGTFFLEPIFQFGSTTTSGLPVLPQIGVSATILPALAAGTTYTCFLGIGDAIPSGTPNYTNMTFSLACVELR